MSKTHRSRAPSQRQLRVGEEVRHMLSALFLRGDFRDPALQSLNVTVTEVRLSPDLHNATVFVTPLGGQHLGEAVSALRRASSFLRSQIARELQLRHAPSLSFEADTSFDDASRIDQLLHLPEVVRDLHPHREAVESGDGNGDGHEDRDEGAGRPDGGA
jgi:ribosome-binding factor A